MHEMRKKSTTIINNRRDTKTANVDRRIIHLAFSCGPTPTVLLLSVGPSI